MFLNFSILENNFFRTFLYKNNKYGNLGLYKLSNIKEAYGRHDSLYLYLIYFRDFCSDQ